MAVESGPSTPGPPRHALGNRTTPTHGYGMVPAQHGAVESDSSRTLTTMSGAKAGIALMGCSIVETNPDRCRLMNFGRARLALWTP